MINFTCDIEENPSENRNAARVTYPYGCNWPFCRPAGIVKGASAGLMARGSQAHHPIINIEGFLVLAIAFVAGIYHDIHVCAKLYARGISMHYMLNTYR